MHEYAWLPRLNLSPSERKAARQGNGKQAIIKDKSIYYENQPVKAAVYDRSRLNAGDRFSGPAVIVEYSATTFLPPESSSRSR